MIEQVHLLPITGSVLNWETFSGDPNDPVRCIGPLELASSFVWPVGIPEEERGIEFRLLSIDVEVGTARVSITANPIFHAALGGRLTGRTIAQISSEFGLTHLTRPANAKKPRVGLKFGE